MKLTTAIRALHPRAVFRISRGARAEVRNVFVQVEQDGIVGHGEASPNAFYGETPEDVNSKLLRAADWLRGREMREVKEIEQTWREAWPLLEPSRGAQCALDLALWDWAAKRRRITVCELALGEKPRPVASFATIGISTREELEEKIEELKTFPFIKIKMDATADIEAVRRIRARTSARLAVDANAAWGGLNVLTLARELAEIGIEFIEQPLPPSEDDCMPQLQAESPIPFLSDESCVATGDVARMAGRFWGFNIKLVKCGGLTPALEMLRLGREHGLRTMAGCMLESSALIAAGAVVAQRTEFADLDGAWLIGDDPFEGWIFSQGRLTAGDGDGLGCAPVDGLFAG